MPTAVIDKFTQGGLNSGLSLLQTTDGKPYAELWNQVLAPSLEDYNAQLNALAGFLGYRDDNRVVSVSQAWAAPWQDRTEVNPTGQNLKNRTWTVRTSYREKAQSLGWTRRALEKMSSEMVVNIFNSVLKSLTDQQYTELLAAFYTSTERDILDVDTHEALKIWTLVNGTGNMPIPRRGVNTFATNHNHFIWTDASSGTWTDTNNRESRIKQLIRLVTEHGFSDNIILMVQGDMLDAIEQCPGYRTLRELSSFASSDPSALVGGDPQASLLSRKKFGGVFEVTGTIANATVVTGDLIPLNYISCFSFQGFNSPENPLQWYEEPVRTMTNSPFPYLETHLETAYGAGVRKRLNGANLYVAAGASAYVDPAVTTASAMAGDWDGVE